MTAVGTQDEERGRPAPIICCEQQSVDVVSAAAQLLCTESLTSAYTRCGPSTCGCVIRACNARLHMYICSRMRAC